MATRHTLLATAPMCQLTPYSPTPSIPTPLIVRFVLLAITRSSIVMIVLQVQASGLFSDDFQVDLLTPCFLRSLIHIVAQVTPLAH